MSENPFCFPNSDSSSIKKHTNTQTSVYTHTVYHTQTDNKQKHMHTLTASSLTLAERLIIAVGYEMVKTSHTREVKTNIWSTEWRNMIAFQSQPTSNSSGSTASSQSETNSQVICQKLCIIQKPPSFKNIQIWKTSLNGSNNGYFPLKYLTGKKDCDVDLKVGLPFISPHTAIYILNLVISYFD